MYKIFFCRAYPQVVRGLVDGAWDWKAAVGGFDPAEFSIFCYCFICKKKTEVRTKVP